MGAKIQQDSSGIWIVDISGALRKEELDAVQAVGVKGMGSHNTEKVLVMVAEDFAGWVGGEVWNDMKFFVEHGDRILKIAIVGDPKWESRMMMFSGAGLRRTKVKYFATHQLPEAHFWLNG